MRFLETLKVYRFGRFKPVMLSKNWFSSRRRVRICQVVDCCRNMTRISCCETNRDVTIGKEMGRKWETSPKTHCKQKQLKSSEVEEIRNRVRETVLLETQNSKPSERCKRLETTLQVETFEHEVRHSVLEIGNVVSAARVNHYVASSELVSNIIYFTKIFSFNISFLSLK